MGDCLGQDFRFNFSNLFFWSSQWSSLWQALPLRLAYSEPLGSETPNCKVRHRVPEDASVSTAPGPVSGHWTRKSPSPLPVFLAWLYGMVERLCALLPLLQGRKWALKLPNIPQLPSSVSFGLILSGTSSRHTTASDGAPAGSSSLRALLPVGPVSHSLLCPGRKRKWAGALSCVSMSLRDGAHSTSGTTSLISPTGRG